MKLQSVAQLRHFLNDQVRRPMMSLVTWGIIIETKPKGIYLAGKQATPKKSDHLAWLAEAVLISRGKTQMGLSELCNHPALFPFALDKLNAAVLQPNPRLRVERQSLNQEFVFLAARPRIVSSYP